MDDYGYFGKGLTGYVHYNEAVKRSSGGGGGGSGGGNIGCGTWALIFCVAYVIFYIIGAIGSCS